MTARRTTRDRRPSIVETLPDWAHAVLAVFVASTSALIAQVLM